MQLSCHFGEPWQTTCVEAESYARSMHLRMHHSIERALQARIADGTVPERISVEPIYVGDFAIGRAIKVDGREVWRGWWEFISARAAIWKER